MNLLCGDSLELLKTLPDESIDSLVTDPPAGIAFMGKDWDKDKGGRDAWIAWMTEIMRECLRVMKPGAHGLVWAIPRTSHWMATALENAGFEVRDVVTHLFGSGFPKSLDVSKAIDKAAGAERPVIGRRKADDIRGGNLNHRACDGNAKTHMIDITAPATDAARQWQGWGTALKPASEHWILVRKPLGEKTVAANVLKHGTGGINIDGCRIGSDTIQVNCHRGGKYAAFRGGEQGEFYTKTHAGRFPANLVLSHSEDCTDDQCDEGCAVKTLDEQSGILKSGEWPARRTGLGFYGGSGTKGDQRRVANEGGASRFFYCAKASKSDRNRKAKHEPEQAPDRKAHEAHELFDPAGNAARGHGA